MLNYDNYLINYPFVKRNYLLKNLKKEYLGMEVKWYSFQETLNGVTQKLCITFNEWNQGKYSKIINPFITVKKYFIHFRSCQ